MWLGRLQARKMRIMTRDKLIDTDHIKALISKAKKLVDHRGEAYVPSRPMNWGYCCKSSSFGTTLASILNELEAVEDRQRQRSIGARVRFKDVLESLVLGLYVAWKSDNRLQLGISLSRNDYNSSNDYHKGIKFYDGLSLSFTDIRAAYKGLKQLGYMAVAKKGYFDRAEGGGKRTRIIATDKLISLLETQAHITPYAISPRTGAGVVILKDRSKRIIPYRPNGFTRRVTENLKRINQCLSEVWIDLLLTDDELETLRIRQLGKSQANNTIPSTVDFNARSLKRIFNNKDWKQGGRFYGPWWQSIPSSYRKHIHINDKETVELDYSGMHPTMLYAEVNTQAPDDPYDMGLHKIDRKIKKKTFNALINASNGQLRKLPEYDPEQTGLTWCDFLAKIKEYHQPISKFFGTGHGLILQGKDAEIAERVMLEFAEMGYPCLPVHDSFIIHHALKDELQNAMEKAFEETVGTPANIDPKSIFTYIPIDDAREVDMKQSIQETLSHDGPYQAYNQRKREWYS